MSDRKRENRENPLGGEGLGGNLCKREGLPKGGKKGGGSKT